jgi:hypothetical protein
MGVGCQRHALVGLQPGKTRYSLYRRLSWPLSPSGRVWKISPPTGIRSPDRSVRSESLYRLRYPGSPGVTVVIVTTFMLNKYLSVYRGFWKQLESVMT